MIAASVKDGDAIVDLLLQKGADVNQKSEDLDSESADFVRHDTDHSCLTDNNGQVRSVTGS